MSQWHKGKKKLIKVDNVSSPCREALLGATRVRPASLPSFIFCPSFIYLSSCISDWPISLRSSTYARRQRREEERGFRAAFSWKIAAVRPWRCTHGGTACAACIICRTSACHQTWHQRPLVTRIALGLPIQPASIKERRWMGASSLGAAWKDLQASVLRVQTMGASLSACLSNQIKTDNAAKVLQTTFPANPTAPPKKLRHYHRAWYWRILHFVAFKRPYRRRLLSDRHFCLFPHSGSFKGVYVR